MYLKVNEIFFKATGHSVVKILVIGMIIFTKDWFYSLNPLRRQSNFKIMSVEFGIPLGSEYF